MMNMIDVSIRTMVGQLPDIINYNNKLIQNEINKFFDGTKINVANVSTSLFTTNNAKIENVSVGNIVIDSSQCKTNIVSGVSHQQLSERYLNYDHEPIDNTSITSAMTDFAHNAESIGYEWNGTVKSVQSVLDSLLKHTSDSSTDTTSNSNTYGLSVNNYINLSSNKTVKNTLDESYLFKNKSQLRSLKLMKYQLNDLSEGNLYTYYEYSPVITIDDEHVSSINGNEGDLIKIKFNDLKKKAYYRIVLSRKENTILRLSKDELLRVTLVCTGYSDEYGAEWDVEQYSVRNKEDITIEHK